MARRLAKLVSSGKRRYTDAVDLPKLQPRIVLDDIIPQDRATFASYHIRGPFTYETQEENTAVLAEYRSLVEAPIEDYQYVHPAKASRILYLICELRIRSFNTESVTLFKSARTKWNLIPNNESAEYALAAASDLSEALHADVAHLIVTDIMHGKIMPDLWLLNMTFTALYRTKEYETASELWDFYQENLGPENKVRPDGRKYFVLYASTISALMQTAWRLRDSVLGASVFRFARKYNVPLSVIVWRRYLRLLYEEERFEDIVDEWPAVRPLVAAGEFPETDTRAFLISARRLRKIDIAEDVFSLLKATIPKLSWFTYSAMVAVYARSGQIEQVHKFLDLMRDEDLPIGSAPYTTLLSHYSDVGDIAKFKEVWQTMLRDPSTELEPTTAAVALRLFRKQKDYANSWYLRSVDVNYVRDPAILSQLSGRIPYFLTRVTERINDPSPKQAPIRVTPRFFAAMVRLAYDVGPIQEWRDLISTLFSQRAFKMSLEALSHLIYIVDTLHVLPEEQREAILNQTTSAFKSKDRETSDLKTTSKAYMKHMWRFLIVPALEKMDEKYARDLLKSSYASYTDPLATTDLPPTLNDQTSNINTPL